MAFDPDQHNRHSIRLYGYDYTVPGYYYVTICTKNRISHLGTVIDDVVILSTWGRIAYENWRKIPEHFSSVGLDYFVIMPNHIHGVIILRDADATKRQPNPPEKNTPINVQNVGAQHAAPLIPKIAPGSIGAIVRSYKSSVTREVNRLRNTPGMRFWQRNYYEHIIRNENELAHLREYIRLNPAKWLEDRYYYD